MIVTNMLGVAFAATVMGATDAGVTFVFPEDGATNALAWSQLSVDSQDAVCRACGFAPVPGELVATWHQARRSLSRLDAFIAERRIEKDEAARRRLAIRAAFEKRCRAHGVSEERLALLMVRLEKENR